MLNFPKTKNKKSSTLIKAFTPLIRKTAQGREKRVGAERPVTPDNLEQIIMRIILYIVLLQ